MAPSSKVNPRNWNFLRINSRILKSYSSTCFAEAPGTEKGQYRSVANECMAFLKYADKYDLSEVSDVVYQPLQTSLSALVSMHAAHKKTKLVLVEVQYIETVSQTTSATSCLRSLIAQACLSDTGMGHLGAFIQQEEQVPGFAAELLKQIHLCRKSVGRWTDPLTLETRND